MNFIEKKLAELHQYMPDQTAPEDLDSFWERTLHLASQKPLNDRREQVTCLSPYITTYKVTYEGYDQTPIHGWYILPKFVDPGAGRLPCVVHYHGYHGSKSVPENYANWLMMGFAVLAMDVRGQGGETGNLLPQSYGMTKGWITQGLLAPEQSYYQAITVDALQALTWAKQQPEVDASHIVVAGASQGGGLALITSALSDIPCKVIADIPNMCHMDFGIFNSVGSLSEAASFVMTYPEHLQEVMRTLSYFDILNLTDRLTKPIFMSVGLKDPICQPETVFAVYNRITSPKEMHVYPFNGHHTSGDHFGKIIRFLRG